jgi:hypothetical protein
LPKTPTSKNGILVVKGGDGVVGTSNVASTFTLTEVAPSGRQQPLMGMRLLGARSLPLTKVMLKGS